MNTLNRLIIIIKYPTTYNIRHVKLGHKWTNGQIAHIKHPNYIGIRENETINDIFHLRNDYALFADDTCVYVINNDFTHGKLTIYDDIAKNSLKIQWGSLYTFETKRNRRNQKRAR